MTSTSTWCRRSARAAGEQHHRHPGIAVTVSSGDNGHGVELPAASQYVTAVGGPSLRRDSRSRRWSETAWNGAGSGCSACITKPSWRADAGCSRRTVADVSAVADPNTGVAVYDSFHEPGWSVFGGTRAPSPIIASVHALAGNTSTLTYARATYGVSSLYDLTSGSDGTCSGSYLGTAKSGYDGPTGNETPNGTGAF